MINRTHRGMAAAVLAGVFGVASLTGCTATEAVEADHAAAACSSLSELDSVLASATTELKEAKTVGELRTIRENVAQAYDRADTALETVAKDRAAGLQEAWSTFSAQVQSIGDDAAITDARDALVSEAKVLAEARATAQADLVCK